MIAVLGAGESGVGAALLAKQKGYDVFVSDSGIVNDHFQNELVSAGLEWEPVSYTHLTLPTKRIV